MDGSKGVDSLVRQASLEVADELIKHYKYDINHGTIRGVVVTVLTEDGTVLASCTRKIEQKYTAEEAKPVNTINEPSAVQGPVISPVQKSGMQTSGAALQDEVDQNNQKARIASDWADANRTAHTRFKIPEQVPSMGSLVRDAMWSLCDRINNTEIGGIPAAAASDVSRVTVTVSGNDDRVKYSSGASLGRKR